MILWAFIASSPPPRRPSLLLHTDAGLIALARLHRHHMTSSLTKRGDAPVRVERSLIEQEDYLQRTVYENPESIPLHELKDDIRLLVLAREFPTGSGPIDALGIDADGDVYVIETKLYKNADKRRVVAQMLDYGASLWSTYSEPTAFTRQIDRALQKSSSTPLAEKLAAFYDLADDERVNEILGAIERNLSEGRFRFVVLMDRLDDRLRDMIRFVNQHSRCDILGVELDFYQHGEFEIIIPDLFGAEIRKRWSHLRGGRNARGTKSASLVKPPTCSPRRRSAQ